MRKVLIAIVLIIAIVSGGLYYLNFDSNTFINLSKTDKLEEYEYLWKELRASYPFTGLTERMGIDINQVYKDNKEIVTNSKTDIEYLKSLYFTIKDFKGSGHLSMITPKTYSTVYEPSFNALKQGNSETISLMEPWLTTFYNESVTSSYDMLDKTSFSFRTIKNLKKKPSVGPVLPNDNDGKDNLTVGIIERNKTAYIKVDSFLLTNLREDKETLALFYEDIKNYENLIIDIRDNSGGSDLYWRELLVAPNINKTLTYDRFSLLKMNETIKPFIDNRFNSNELLPINKLPKFTNINENDLKEMTHFIKSTTTVEPINYSEFKGKVWVLTSSKNYSASENFAMFCKETNFATLVGEVTNGDGGIMDPVLVSLPKSKMLITYSVLYGLNSDGSCNEEFGTTPDYLINEGEDALAVCKQLTKMEN